VTILAPICLKVVFFLADGLTRNHSFITVVSTVCVTILFRRMTRSFAPSAKQAEEDLDRYKLRIPFGVFTLITLIVRFIIVRFEESLGWANSLTWSPSFSFGVAVQLALGMLFLGISVIFQYIGPASVVRCSSSPLFENPVSGWIKAAGVNLQHSPAAFADFMSKPSEINASSTGWSFANNARRLQRPTLWATAQQLLASIIIGTMVAYTCAVPLFSKWFPSGSPSTIVASCIFAVVINLLSRLDGVAHEISPYRHRFGARSDRGLFGELSLSNPSFIIIACVVVPILSLLSSFGSREPNTGTFSSFMACPVTTWLIIFYLNFVDEELRKALCATPINMKRTVDEISGEEGMQTYLDVTMCSILHSDLALVEQLSAIGKVRLLSLDREERVLNEEAMKSMANNLLQKTSGDENGAHLEEDIFRLSILSSLGGSGRGGGPPFDDAGKHHLQNIRLWVPPPKTEQDGVSRNEISPVPLVRALCALGGGFGEALTMCSSQPTSSPIFPWSLPPGALVQSEYSIRAAARCIVCSLVNSAQCRTDWRSSHLSMMIPVFLNSACRLQTGAVRYVERKRAFKQAIATKKKVKSKALAVGLEAPFNPDQDRHLLQTESPELLPVYNACNSSASMILEQLYSLDGGKYHGLRLEGVTQRWVKHLTDIIGSMTNQSTNGIMPAAY